ncbi:Tat pathway signal sequence domain protein [Sphingobium aquiterrae]|uniref:exo-rhamnogalacturonan lyase family protein n=1 Tax=Sphingobium aquiterrae TaxID=2038656 RepID=UPI00301914EE
MDSDGGAITRRDTMKLAAGAAVVAGAALGEPVSGATARAQPVAARWLGDVAPPAGPDLSWGLSYGLSWGVPWPRGTLRKDSTLTAHGPDGTPVPLQSWPLAYWPDGSLKWTGHAAGGTMSAPEIRIEPGRGTPPAAPVIVTERPDAVVIRTGTSAYVLPRSGPVLIAEATRDGKARLRNGRLICLRQDSADIGAPAIRTEAFESLVQSVHVEQKGPVRALVRIDGVHSGRGRSWMPFTIRIAVFADGGMARIVHSLVFDGDGEKDFLSGLGIRFDVPMADEPQNRHIRFAGEGTGLWGEAVRNLPGWQPELFTLAPRFQDQLDGRPIPMLAEMDAKTRDQLLQVPSFGDFKLFQGGSRQFTVTKRRKPGLAWIKADHGGRASGLAYVGGTSGGVSLGLRDFWQRHPTAIEVNGADGDIATLTMWLWSPDGGAMDLRHYSDGPHGLDINYEDYEEGFATATGIGRTSELFLWLHDATPSRDMLAAMAGVVRAPPLLAVSPAHLHATGVFGLWSLPDRSTPVKARLEEEYDRLLAFYAQEVEQRDWYGFWDYGDIMHSYDDDRHVWRYDVGGYAWDNSEMGSDLWLWYGFLRSGDAGRFRMAEAMTRHTSEVDFYHVGRFAGLGTRHGVRHWGDGAKEPRISMAPIRRFLHYLTADERTGDLMRMVVDADHAIAAISPVRKIMEPSRFPAVARSGPDWFAFAGNWMTEWERTGDSRWRDKILRGMKALATMPDGLFTGPPLGYDPETGQLFDIGYHFKVYYLLTMIFGGAEVLFELDTLLDMPDFDAALVRYGETWNLPEAERVKALGPGALNPLFGGEKLYTTVWYARMTAYAAWKKKDPALARRAWTELLRGRGGVLPKPFLQAPARETAGPATLEPRREIPGLTTNNVAQWSLNFVELLALAGDAAPDAL